MLIAGSVSQSRVGGVDRVLRFQTQAVTTIKTRSADVSIPTEETDRALIPPDAEAIFGPNVIRIRLF